MTSGVIGAGSRVRSLGQNAGMKKWGAIAAMVAFAVYAVLSLVHDFAANDPIGYFSEAPSRLLYVAEIAITGAW